MADVPRDDPETDARYGLAAWEAAGKPMFGKMYTYNELLTVDVPGRRRGKKYEEKPPRPDCWPPDTEVDPGKWVFWLPEGWMQGVRTQPASGKILKCYFSPENRRFWHKKDIEKFVGYVLPTSEDHLPANEEDGVKEKRVKYVTDPDVVPGWPEDEEDWLPKDWRLVFRQLPTGPHKVYVPPGQDEGFLYHRHLVGEYLSGAKTSLSMFGTSRPMAEISAEAASRPAGSKSHKKKSHRKPMVSEAAEKDYVPCEGMQVVELPATNESAEIQKALQDVPNENSISSDCVKLRSLLAERFFSVDTGMLVVFFRGDLVSKNRFAKYASGVYCQLPGTFNDRPYYQRVSLTESAPGICCKACFLFWNVTKGDWRIAASFDAKNAGIARRHEDSQRPPSGGEAWMLLRPDFGGLDQAVSDPVPAPQASTDAAAKVAIKEEPAKQEAVPAKRKSVEEDAKDAKTPKLAKVEEDARRGSKESKEAEDQKLAKRPNGATIIDRGTWDGVLHRDKIWSYQDVQEAIKNARKGEDVVGYPKHWPPGLTVYPGRWAEWLPDDWGQAQREEYMSGRRLTKYVSPTGKVVHSKKDVEKAVGRELDARELAIPDWPPWLPKEWHKSIKVASNGATQAIYITPCRTRYFWTKARVETCLASNLVGQQGPILKVADGNS